MLSSDFGECEPKIKNENWLNSEKSIAFKCDQKKFVNQSELYFHLNASFNQFVGSIFFKHIDEQ